MYLQDRAHCWLRNVTFRGNVAESSAGAIALLVNSTAIIVDCIFEENRSGSKGGAVAALNRGHPIIRRTIIRNNTAKSGGAIYCTDSTITQVEHCVINDNLAMSRGGALYTSGEATLVIKNSTVDRNTAQSGPGGGVLLQDFVQIDFTNVTVSVRIPTLALSFPLIFMSYRTIMLHMVVQCITSRILHWRQPVV
mgnify:CR=1 FL=1